MLAGDSGEIVWAVADGVGGSPFGREASRLALETLRAQLDLRHSVAGGLRTAILDGMDAANRNVMALGAGAASTLTVVEVVEEWLRSYQVGDSQVLVVGQRGRLKHQSIAHGPIGYAVESGLLDEAEALSHAERHVVSNTLGSPDMRIEIGPRLRLALRDTVLVGSDGLFDNLYTDEIVDLVRKGPLPDAGTRLANMAQRRMTHPKEGEPSKEDDLTFLLFRRAAARKDGRASRAPANRRSRDAGEGRSWSESAAGSESVAGRR
jgi:serine/threonine protein phosphatase PrpC